MNQTDIAQNIEANHVAVDIGDTDLHGEAYSEGAFFAETDWQCNRKRPGFLWGPDSMAEHCTAVWADIVANVHPEWNNQHVRLSFFIGYEDRATDLAAAGEAGYETLAEAGTVADTDGWTLQSAPWSEEASASEKALRAVRAVWAGAAAWQARAEASGDLGDAHRAEEALSRMETAGEYMADSRHMAGGGTHTH
ncbi:hypothetical protein [Paraburkholderia hospita]|uniref:hypothetical protein n=1 Tax=Paraburkholderia hospita TaxID=169430 RepID=UPI003ECEC520